MPTAELGAPANRKFDMEAWMPAKQFWGEVWNIITISDCLLSKIIHAEICLCCTSSPGQILEKKLFSC